MRFISSGLAAAITLLAAQAAQAQTHRIIRVFSGGDPSDVRAPLVLGPDGAFYGASDLGGSFGDGTVFRTTTSGALTVLHNFTFTGVSPRWLTFGPDGNLFVTAAGFPIQPAAIFKLSPNGTQFSTLRTFDPNVEMVPMPGPVAFGTDGNLYGLVGSSAAWNSYRLSPAGAYTLLSSGSSSPSAPQMVHDIATGPDGNMYAVSVIGGDQNRGTFFRLGTDGAVTVLHSFTADEGEPVSAFVPDQNGNFYGVVSADDVPTAVRAISSMKLLKITTSGSVISQVPFGAMFSMGFDPAPVLGIDGNFYGTMMGSCDRCGVIYRLTPDGNFTFGHQFGDAPTGLQAFGLTRAPDGLLYGTTSKTAPVVGGGTFYALGLPWALPFDAGDAAAPWQFPDWQYGEYKAECPFPGSLPFGISLSPSNSGTRAGAAHAVICNEPLEHDMSHPFGYFQARAGESLTVNENVETFYDHDSTHVGSRTLPQYPNNDWDWGYYKGQCGAGAFVTGIAQTGDWDAPTDSGVGTKPRRTLDHLLCSRTRCDSASGPYTAGNQCTARGVLTDPPLDDWRFGNPSDLNSFPKMQCNDGEAMVGISVDTGAHRPHKILCCKLERTFC